MPNRIYPVSFGFNISVEIIRNLETDNAKVVIHSPMYRNKQSAMPHSYKASQYSDCEILRDSDFIRVMAGKFPAVK